MKRYGIPAAALLAVMLGLPWLAVTFLRGDAGMAACFALFFAVDPLLAVIFGVLAGLRREWWWPAAMAAAFVLGAWLVFAPGEMAFLLYAGFYLVIGVVVMALTALLRKRLARRTGK